MEIFCHKCGTKNIDRDTCLNCNTKLHTENKAVSVQKIVQLECPWCKTVNRVTDQTHCKSCGGPLPATSEDNSAIDRGAPPENPPRQLPEVYVKKLKYKNIHFIIGIIFTVPFFWTVIFPIIGILLMRHGLKTAKQKIEALEKGVKAEGVLVDIYKDTTQTVNGRHPWRLDYEFTTKRGDIISAKKTGAWNNNNRFRNPNDKLWVVYLPENPEISAIWPPVD